MLPRVTERLYAQIAALLREHWDIAKLTRLRPVRKGRHGAAFEVVCGDRSLLLLLVDHTFSRAAIESAVRVMRHMAACRYPVPALHATLDAQSVVRGVEGRFALLTDFPEGRAIGYDVVTMRVAAAWGERLASCHAALDELADSAPYRRPPRPDGDAAAPPLHFLGPDGLRDDPRFAAMADTAEDAGPRLQRLTQPMTHGDFSRDAVLFDGSGVVSAVLDWMYVCARPRCVELLEAVALLCRRADGVLDAGMTGALIEAYQHVFPLPKAETECPVAVYLAWCATSGAIRPAAGDPAVDRERLTCLWDARDALEAAVAESRRG